MSFLNRVSVPVFLFRACYGTNLKNMSAAITSLLQTRFNCTVDAVSDISEYLCTVIRENEFSLPAEDVAALLEAQLDATPVSTKGVNFIELATQVVSTLQSSKDEPAAITRDSGPALLAHTVRIGKATPSAQLAPDNPKPINPEITASAASKAKSAARVASDPLKGSAAVVASGLTELSEIDDWGSAWAEVVESGEKWGRRGHGGRGMGRITQVSAGKDVVLEGVTMAFAGKELLTRSSIRLIHGHKYALLGANGVGKTTLLR